MTGRAARAWTVLGISWLGLVAAACVREVLVASEVLPLDAPSGGAAAEWLSGAGFLAVFTAWVVLLVSPASRPATWPAHLRVVAAAVPLGAAAFMLSVIAAFDPYYGPGVRRYAENGVPAWWFAAAVALALAAAAVTLWRRGTAGPLMASAACALAGFLTIVPGMGH